MKLQRAIWFTCIYSHCEENVMLMLGVGGSKRDRARSLGWNPLPGKTKQALMRPSVTQRPSAWQSLCRRASRLPELCSVRLGAGGSTGCWGPGGQSVAECPARGMPESWWVFVQGVARPSFTRALTSAPFESSLSSKFCLFDKGSLWD